MRADARNALLQAGDLAARAARGPLEAGWSHSDPLILETQGVMSAAAVEPLVRFVFPSLEGLPERLAAPGAAFLDVGAGVAEIGLELCRRFEHLRVVGLEPSAAPRELAAGEDRGGRAGGSHRDARPARRGARRRGGLRRRVDGAAVPAAAAWPTRRSGPCTGRCAPAGWLLIATLGSPARGDLGDALAAFRSVLWGGGPLAPDAVEELLAAAGFADVQAMPRTPARLTPLFARRQ